MSLNFAKLFAALDCRSPILNSREIKKGSAMRFAFSSLFTNIGSCSFCIQTAFRAALAAAGAFCILLILDLINAVSFPTYITYLALTLVLLLASLWVLHVVVFGIRAADFSTRKALDADAQNDKSEATIVSRRNYL